MTRQLLYSLTTLLASAAAAAAADPWADNVEEYVPGSDVASVFNSNPPIFFDQPTSALGAPTRSDVGGAPITPTNPASTPEEVVSIGVGGSLIVSFDEPVTNHPANPFGIDLLIFGNAQLFNLAVFPPTPSTPLTDAFTEGGLVEVSADGMNYFPVPGEADGLFPTFGFQDAAGLIASDFTLPVDPSLSPFGLTQSELLTAYAGSGGGLGIDIGAVGLSEVSYVRVTNPVASSISFPDTPEIDAFVDVRPIPEPSSLVLLLLGFAAVRRNRR